jgi:hypothetical protein
MDRAADLGRAVRAERDPEMAREVAVLQVDLLKVEADRFESRTGPGIWMSGAVMLGQDHRWCVRERASQEREQEAA